MKTMEEYLESKDQHLKEGRDCVHIRFDDLESWILEADENGTLSASSHSHAMDERDEIALQLEKAREEIDRLSSECERWIELLEKRSEMDAHLAASLARSIEANDKALVEISELRAVMDMIRDLNFDRIEDGLEARRIYWREGGRDQWLEHEYKAQLKLIEDIKEKVGVK